MNKKIIFLLCLFMVMVWSVGCSCTGEHPAAAPSAPIVAVGTAAINPCDPAAPQGWPRKYTGIIRNRTGEDVNVHSGNSDGTLTIPANDWIEYDAWLRHFDLTAYNEGKPYCCLKICANPESYPFMCRKYDFVVEICQAEGKIGHGPSKKLKRRIRHHEKAVS